MMSLVNTMKQCLMYICCCKIRLLMYKNRQYKERFDVVDLDPYGTAAPFFDAAVQSVADGGEAYVIC